MDKIDQYCKFREDGVQAGFSNNANQKRKKRDPAYRIGLVVGRIRYRQFIRSCMDHVSLSGPPQIVLPKRLIRMEHALLEKVCGQKSKLDRGRRPRVDQLSVLVAKEHAQVASSESGGTFDLILQLAEMGAGRL